MKSGFEEVGMRTALLAFAGAMTLASFVGPAGATVLNPGAVREGYPAAVANRTACPAGSYWSLEHYDRHQQLWPTGCVPNNT
jgi:hypothetical protein